MSWPSWAKDMGGYVTVDIEAAAAEGVVFEDMDTHVRVDLERAATKGTVIEDMGSYARVPE